MAVLGNGRSLTEGWGNPGSRTPGQGVATPDRPVRTELDRVGQAGPNGWAGAGLRRRIRYLGMKNAPPGRGVFTDQCG